MRDVRPRDGVIAAARVAAIYAAGAMTWILISSTLSARGTQRVADVELREITKGLVFVIVTAALLYFMMRLEFKRRSGILHALDANSARLRDLADATHTLVFTTDDRGVVTYASQVTERILGLPPDAVVGRLFSDLVARDEADAAAKTIDDLLAQDTPVQRLVVRMRRADGSVVAAELSASRSMFDGRPGTVGTLRDVSAMRTAEETLQRNEREQRERAHLLGEERTRLVEAQAVARVGSWETDVATQRVTWTDETHRIFGTDPATFVPTHASFLELVHPADRGAVDAAFEAALRKTDVQTLEHRIVRPDGIERIVEERWMCVAGLDGAAQRAVGTCRDVSEQRRAEAALRESQRMIEHIVNAVPVRVFWKDRDLRYLGCNVAFARDAGASAAGEIVGRDDTDLGWRAQAAGYQAADRRVIDSGEAELLIEETQTTPTGGTICLLTNKLPLRNSAGEVVGVIGTYMDVTARKQVEAAQARLATAVEQAAEAVVITDAAGHIVYVNPAFERISGYTRAEVYGQNPRVLKSGRHDAAFYRNIWETIVAGGDWRGRIVNRRKDGALLEEDVVISPVRDSAGRIIHFVAVKHDVSEQVFLQNQLAQAQKMEAVGQLAGGVAHDFNNLLTVINGYSDMLLTKFAADDPKREWITDISRAGGRAAALTRQLLAFSRRQVLDPRVIDLNGIVDDTQKMLGRLIGEDVILSIRTSDDPAMVRADPGQVEQVVLNLAVNARDAMPRGGSLTIGTRHAVLDDAQARARIGATPGRHVVLSVTDTGHGMDDATLAHIFEPFFTTKKAGQGTGLGLATVHGIVRQSGGHLVVTSIVGQGTTFEVWLPQADVDVPTGQTSGEPEGAPGGSETILLVEDEQTVRSLGMRVLQSCGYRVLEASDGNEALERAASHAGEIHLLVSDVVMPHLGGRELAERFRAIRPECRVLFVSGYTDDAVIRHGVREAEFAFLQKPFTPMTLARKVRRVLDGG